MIFSKARLILPDGIRENAELHIAHGRIVDQVGGADAEIVDLRGNYLAPGFIDGHVHGARGRDTMEGTGSAFETICAYHASGGTTSLLLTTATAPIPEVVRVLYTVEQAAAIMPQIAGVHLEGPFLSRHKAGAQRQDLLTNPTPEAFIPLLAHSGVVKLITIAPELLGALTLIDEMRLRGIRVSGGHSDAWDDEARAAFAHGMHQVTHTFNCMSTTRRRGLYRIAGLLEYALSQPGIVCELIADGHHVSPTLMQMLYRAKGAGGISLVTDATAGAGLADGVHYELSGVECIVQGGVGIVANGSALAGSTCRMIDCIKTMVYMVGVPLHEAVGMATANPARALGWTDRGVLAAGKMADLVVLSPELEVISTYLRGTRIFSRSEAILES